MVKKYIIGSWANGQISETSVLPVIRDDSFSWEVQGVSSGEISIPKLELPDPSQWKEYLKVGEKLILIVDDEKPWDAHGEAILGGGYIIRQTARVNDTIRVKFTGPDQYLTQRYVTSVYTGSVADPTVKALDLTGDSYQSLIAQTISHAFTASGSGPQPPQMPIYYPSMNGGSIKYSCLNSDFMTYQNVLDELFDASPYGNEWRWEWQWTSSAKNQVALKLTVGADHSVSASQIGSDITKNIVLDGSTYKITGFEQGDELNNSATRLIAQSKAGDEETKTGSDYVVRTTSGTVLYDTVFNPGVELDNAQMEAQLSSRLASLSNLTGDTTLEVAEPVENWLPFLGAILNISGGSNQFSSGFNAQVRLNKITGSMGEVNTKLEITPLQARYPKLPPKNPFVPNKNSGSGGGIGGGRPVVPKLPNNQPKPPTGGGGGGGGTPTMPDFDSGPVFENAEPYMEYSRYDSKNYSSEAHFQAGNFIYSLSNTMITEYTTISASDLEDFNIQVNNFIISKLKSMSVNRITFIDDISPLNDENLFNLDLKSIHENTPLIPGFTDFTPQMSYSINLNTKSVIWVNNGEVFVWFYGFIQRESFEGVKSNWGSKVFKRTLTGNQDWVDAGFVMKSGGKYIYPFSQNTLMVRDGNLYIAGYCYIDYSTNNGINIPKYVGLAPEVYIDGFLQEGSVGKYAFGILEITTGGQISNLGTPAFSSPMYSTYEYTAFSKPKYIVPHPLRWVKGEGNADSRVGIILQNLQFFGEEYAANVEKSASEIAVAYWGKNQPATQIAFLNVLTKQTYSLKSNYLIKDGMIFIISNQWNPGKDEVLYTHRTKNSSGQWIKEPYNTPKNSPDLDYGKIDFPVENKYAWSVRYNYYENNLTLGFNQPQDMPIFTWGNYWIASGRGGGSWVRGRLK